MNKKKIEILAPVGSREMLKAAVFSGADAVYLGFSGFNARAGAENFDAEALKEAVLFCHARGVKVHTAINTTVYNEELTNLSKAVWHAADAGVDALIVQDFATAAIAKKIAPKLALHGSTQMSIHTLEGALMAADMGFERVILARELSKHEIAFITAECPIETEIFVHGALCMSVSGQCYMSAFMGGRSGNRGSCAGTCRLPFCAATPVKGETSSHLSLKDNSLLSSLYEIQQLGVASAKIEGRLRTPEYVAAAVSAARAARDKEGFDEQLLQDVFSRSGFTSGYYDGKIDRNMFGVRTKEDSDASKAALPKLRELYRREYERIPVKMVLTIEDEGAKLSITDDNGYMAVVYSEQIPEAAQKDLTENLKRSLSKTGGTPFTVGDIQIVMQNGNWYLPGSAVTELRRRGLEQLMAKRAEVVSKAEAVYHPTVQENPSAPNEKKVLVRLEKLSQLSNEIISSADFIALPLEEALLADERVCAKLLAELPRVMFGGLEEKVRRQVVIAKTRGFAGFVAENIAHIRLLRGLKTFGGFGLNITNSISAQEYIQLGLSGVTLLPEVTAEGISLIRPGVPTAALLYGRMPLMVTRSCPLQNVHSCAQCNREGLLTDRKNKQFPVRCRNGVRTIFNTVPIYMGDKKTALNVDVQVLYFTTETADEVAAVLIKFANNEPFDGEFTRGLYFRGTQSANDSVAAQKG